MKRLLYALPLIFALGGCMAVLGYEPTPEELEAIKRGEDPRANESSPQSGNAGEAAVNESDPYASPATRQPGPAEGTVLRWMDSATLVVEAQNTREVVALVGEKARESMLDERELLDQRMNQWTYGTWVRLSYPLRDEAGETIYRDAEGRLLATID